MLFEALQNTEKIEIFSKINKIIKDFKLSNSAKYGYEFYHCDSAKGLSNYNKEKFLALRNVYNEKKDIFVLFTLIIFAFNNQIRFNAKNEFNLPCGKRDFNKNIQEKLSSFIDALQTKNITLSNKDFRAFDINILDAQSFVYIDPPYLLGIATYSENKAWTLQDEKDLLDFLSLLDSKKIKFALSNVIFHKGREHSVLQDFLKKNSHLKVYFLNFSYENCNYQSKRADSKEVLIINYRD